MHIFVGLGIHIGAKMIKEVLALLLIVDILSISSASRLASGAVTNVSSSTRNGRTKAHAKEPNKQQSTTK